MAAARHGLPLLVEAWQRELELFRVIFFHHSLAVMSEKVLVFLHQFTDPLRSLFEVSDLADPYIENLYLSEPTKSVDGTGLVHFSLEVLC